MCTITQAELEATDRHGQTPLNLAARHGYADVVRVLLAAGASADHADCDGWTALRAAAWGGHTQVNASGKVLSRLLAYRKWPQTVSRKPDIILGTPPSPPIKSARHLDKKLTRTQNAVATLIILINHLSIIISLFFSHYKSCFRSLRLFVVEIAHFCCFSFCFFDVVISSGLF